MRLEIKGYFSFRDCHVEYKDYSYATPIVAVVTTRLTTAVLSKLLRKLCEEFFDLLVIMVVGFGP